MDNKKEKISVVIPAYNEEKGISKVLTDLKTILDNTHLQYEIIIVDDGSSDKTAEIVQKQVFVRLIQHPVNRGYGAALKTGIKSANGDWILITDADGTYPNEYIPELLEYSGKYDMVVGARTGENVSIPLYRRPAKLFLTRLANYLVGTKIPDLNSGMRLFRKEDSMKYFHILPSGFSFTTTITLSYLSDGFLVKYVPIDYHERHGSSKIKPLKDGMNFILLIIKAITYFNPLKVFLPLSFIMFLAAAMLFWYTTFVVGKLADISVIVLIIASIQIGLFGLIADLIVKRSEH
jgi:glycosyltransferase involved in cell wall biosynthesis